VITTIRIIYQYEPSLNVLNRKSIQRHSYRCNIQVKIMRIKVINTCKMSV